MSNKNNEVDLLLSDKMEDTSTFCVMPFIHLSTTTSGQYRYCCNAQSPIPIKYININHELVTNILQQQFKYLFNITKDNFLEYGIEITIDEFKEFETYKKDNTIGKFIKEKIPHNILKLLEENKEFVDLIEFTQKAIDTTHETRKWFFNNYNDYIKKRYSAPSLQQSSIRGFREYIHGYTTNDYTIEDVWNSPSMRDARIKMLNGQKVQGCEKCYMEEKLNYSSSYRQRKNLIEILDKKRINEIASRIKEASTNNGYLSEPLYYLDLKMTTKCNLTCSMCTPAESSGVENYVKHYENTEFHKIDDRLQGDYFKVGAYTEHDKNWGENDFFINELESIGYKLKHLYVTGGEPFLINQLWNVLRSYYEKGYNQNIDLEFVSNLTINDKDKLDLLKQFKKVTISGSIDGFEKSYEYTRWPHTWKFLNSKVEKILKNYADYNFSLHFTSAVSIMNILDLPKLCNWIHNIDLKYSEVKGSQLRTTIFLVTSPQHLCPLYLDKNAKEFVIDHLEAQSKHFDIQNFSKETNLAEEFFNILNVLKNSEQCLEWQHKKVFWNQMDLRNRYINLKFEDTISESYLELLQ